MKRSNKIILAALAATGITFATISWVSAQGGWGGNCYRANLVQGQGYGPGGCQMQGKPGAGQPMPQGCAKQGYGRNAYPGGKRAGRMQGGPGGAMAANLDGVKAQLQITADQEDAWQTFEEVINAKSAMRTERMKQRGTMRSLPVEERTARMREMAGHMTVMADAIDNLNAALSEEQKALFNQMGPMGRRR